jgi:hypothetical protein
MSESIRNSSEIIRPSQKAVVPLPAIDRPQTSAPAKRAKIGVLIRFSNSAETLPDVLAALEARPCALITFLALIRAVGTAREL